MKIYEIPMEPIEVRMAREVMKRAGYWFEAGDFRFLGKNPEEWRALQNELYDIYNHFAQHGALCDVRSESNICTCGHDFIEELRQKHKGVTLA